jgi:hypothetical protein
LEDFKDCELNVTYSGGKDAYVFFDGNGTVTGMHVEEWDSPGEKWERIIKKLQGKIRRGLDHKIVRKVVGSKLRDAIDP